MFVVVLNKPAVVLKSIVILYSLVVDFGGMFVLSGSKVDFRFDDMIKRFRIAVGLGAGFFGVEDIVGLRCNFGDHVARRTYAFKGFYFSHNGNI